MEFDIVLSKKNESTLLIDCDNGILQELSDHFSFFMKGYQFTPKYRAKMWDGKIRLVDLRFGTAPLGLYSDILKYASNNDYKVGTSDSKYGLIGEQANVSRDDIIAFCEGLNLESKGNKITIRDYQIEAIYTCIRNGRNIALSPTSSGKSLILYCIFRWYLHINPDFRTILVVPNLGLIRQMKSDFIDYSSGNDFDIESNIQIIAEGASKAITKPLILSSWQSIYKQPQKWYNDNIDVIMADECHLFAAEAVKGIFEKATEVKHRFGVTGSLSEAKANEMILKGLIGDTFRVTTTRALIDNGSASDIKIGCIVLKYNTESKKLVKAGDYQHEISFLTQHEKRNNFIAKLAVKQTQNTLVMFNKIEHGKLLYELIKSKADSNTDVHLVYGGVDADDRESIRNIVQNSVRKNIIVGSLKTMSTGVNIPRLHVIIFAHPFKSLITLIQSIGRGLRKSADKSHLVLYDIADSIIPSKVRPNHTFGHFVERLKIYVEETFEYKIGEIQLE